MDAARAALDDVFASWAVRERAPALAWGLVRDGELAASGGVGDLGNGVPPDPDTVFRIASMTKSFTGAALMALVAEGSLRLDDPVADHVPALAGWRGPTADGPPLTVRHLVSMEAGLPTDDAWADRHLDIGREELDALIAAGANFAWTPGVAFEYSNLGWGLVGRVIETVAGVTAQELVTERLIEPLGLTSTTWVRPEGATVAEPFRLEDEVPLAEPEPLGDGGIAPMGGIWTTVRDLARWIAFLLDAWPPRDDPDDGPLPRWARREMQQMRRVAEVEAARPRPDGPSRTIAFGYGIGLMVQHDPRLGHVVGHSGGIPGYGSHMRWIADRGVGIVALSNVTYGRMTSACAEALDVLADLDALGERRAPAAAPALAEAAGRAAALLTTWSDADASDLFADNVAQDEALDRRAAEAARVVERHGVITVEDLEAETPLRGTFTAAGGLVKVELGLSHAAEVQWLDVTDRTRPTRDPIVASRATLDRVAGTAYVVVRPTGDLADRFADLRGEVLDRLGGAPATIAEAHVTLKAFGAEARPLAPGDSERLAEVAWAWAATTGPIELRAEAVDVFDGDERVPIVRLAADPLREPMRALWRACEVASLPTGYPDHIGVDGWIPHLSLVYPSDDLPDARWDQIVAWAHEATVEVPACTAIEAELVVFDGGTARTFGPYALTG